MEWCYLDQMQWLWWFVYEGFRENHARQHLLLGVNITYCQEGMRLTLVLSTSPLFILMGNIRDLESKNVLPKFCWIISCGRCRLNGIIDMSLSRPWPSATLTHAFLSPQHHPRAHKAQSQNPTLISNSEHSFPITLKHSWPDLAQPDCLYLSLISSSSLSLTSSHTLLYLYFVPSVWLPEFSVSVNPIPSNP